MMGLQLWRSRQPSMAGGSAGTACPPCSCRPLLLSALVCIANCGRGKFSVLECAYSFNVAAIFIFLIVYGINGGVNVSMDTLTRILHYVLVLVMACMA